VETVFAGGDVPAIAEMLATMRRSLLLVGDVPEFKGGMERLEVRSLCRLDAIRKMPAVVLLPTPPRTCVSLQGLLLPRLAVVTSCADLCV